MWTRTEKIYNLPFINYASLYFSSNPQLYADKVSKVGRSTVWEITINFKNVTK